MRVISGEKRGQRLIAPEGMDVRPTENRTKESLFNILSPILYDSVVLDLFAGSGAIGIEFLSRGSKFTYFIDNSSNSIDTIKENLRHTKLVGKSKVIKTDAIRALEEFRLESTKFDYIYVDPPFIEKDLIEDVLNLVSEGNLLEDKGIVVVEHAKNVNLNEEYNDFKRYDFRKYGKRVISFYKTKEV